MSRTKNKLTVRKLQALAEGTHGDGAGLWCRKTSKSNGQWVFRYRLNAKARQMGLGSMSKVTLAQARELRDEYWKLVQEGQDSMIVRKYQAAVAQSQSVTFCEMAHITFEAK